MVGARDVGIDEAILKVEQMNFGRQDAIDLIASSQNRPSWTNKLGHPLDHCDMILHSWPQGRTISSKDDRNLVELGPMQFRDHPVASRIADIDRFALDRGKSRHSFAWTDLHLIQAVQDMFLAKGAFTALWRLRAAQVPARLVFKKPTSHTTVMDVSVKSTGTATGALANRYMMILDLCADRRLQLQTLYPFDTEFDVEIAVYKSNGDVSFKANY